jgi:hypothetical protein
LTTGKPFWRRAWRSNAGGKNTDDEFWFLFSRMGGKGKSVLAIVLGIRDDQFIAE